MKTPLPIEMLETIAADIAENTVLLELIYKHSNEDHETDCAMACLIRSMKKTLDTTNEYIKSLSDAQQEKGESDIADDVFHASITARKLEELAHVYNEVYFTDGDNGKPSMYMAATIFDYAIKVCSELKNIETKLS
ncbi:TPA: hypothetical protein REW11_005470 [Klebsiella pneumoniae]|nr:hypothetical protein [Klebsiella pneumoniae]